MQNKPGISTSLQDYRVSGMPLQKRKSNSGPPTVPMKQTKQRKRQTNSIYLKRRQLAVKEEQTSAQMLETV